MTSDVAYYINCYLSGGEDTLGCRHCHYGAPVEGTDGHVWCCLHKQMLRDAADVLLESMPAEKRADDDDNNRVN